MLFYRLLVVRPKFFLIKNKKKILNRDLKEILKWFLLLFRILAF